MTGISEESTFTVLPVVNRKVKLYFVATLIFCHDDISNSLENGRDKNTTLVHNEPLHVF